MQSPAEIENKIFSDSIANANKETLNVLEKRCIDDLLAAKKCDDLEKQKAYTECFEALGDIFYHRGRLLQEERQQLKAIALYNLVLASLLSQPQADKLHDDNPIPFSSLNKTQHRLIKKIKAIEERLIQFYGGRALNKTLEEYWQQVEDAKQILSHVRLRAQQELALVGKNETTVQAIYQHIADGIKHDLLRELINECFQVLPLPPGCIYSIIALGSLARSEATPFSDFEFAILIEDQGEERNKIHKEYFRKFTHLLWIKVLNLRETTTRMMDISFLDWLSISERSFYQSKLTEIEWLIEHTSPCKKGFSFDGQMEGGCHTPLGNMHHASAKVDNSQYELIGTPVELAYFHTDVWFEKKRALTTVLSTVDVMTCNDLHMEKSLVQLYEAELYHILNEPIGTNKTRIQKRSLALLADSCEKFKFRGGKFEEECHYFDAKYHLYRLPNMLIDHLAAYFGAKGKSIWNRIEELFAQGGKIHYEIGKTNLNLIVDRILILRLKSYLKKNYREDHIITFDPKNPNEVNEHLLVKYLGIDLEYLFQIYYVLIPLEWAVEKFVVQEDATLLIKKFHFDDRFRVRGWIYSDLLNYDQAEIEYKYGLQAKDKDDPSIVEILSDLGNLYEIQARFSEALDKLFEAERIGEAKLGKEHILVADVLNTIGNVYDSQEKYADAIKMYERAKAIKIKFYGINNISVAGTLMNLGNIYSEQESYQEAIDTYLEAKRICQLNYGKMHDMVADILNNLGIIYREQTRYQDAVDAYVEACKIYKAVNGSEHITVAETLINLGVVYRHQGKYEEAIEAYQKARRIFLQVHNRHHIRLADVLNNLGGVFKAQANYYEAELAYKEAERIYTQIQGSDHPTVAVVLSNLSTIFKAQGRYTEALSACKMAKKIKKAALEGKISASLGQTLVNLGTIYFCQRNYEKAITKLDKARHIFVSKHDENHVLVGIAMAGLGDVYLELKKFEDARKLYNNALEIFKKSHYAEEEKVRKKIYFSPIREGNAFMLEGNLSAAEKCYQNNDLHLATNDPELHYKLAHDFQTNAEILAARESYNIIRQLTPLSSSVNYQLGCLTHIVAQIDKDRNEKSSYLVSLKEADGYFQEALKLDDHIGFFTEYTRFMLRNHSYYSLEVIIHNFLLVLQSKQKDKELSYGLIERPTVDIVLQNLIDKEKKIAFKASHLAHYLLIQTYVLNNQVERAKEILSKFQNSVNIFRQAQEEMKLVLSTQNLLEQEQRDLQVQLQAEEKQLNFLIELLAAAEQLVQFPLNHFLVNESATQVGVPTSHSCV